jgi:hypothetical protein
MLKYKFYCSVHKLMQRFYYFKFTPGTACAWHSSYLENVHFAVVLKSIAYVTLVRKATDCTIITIFLKSFAEKEIHALLISKNKLTNIFVPLYKISRAGCGSLACKNI